MGIGVDVACNDDVRTERKIICCNVDDNCSEYTVNDRIEPPLSNRTPLRIEPPSRGRSKKYNPPFQIEPPGALFERYSRTKHVKSQCKKDEEAVNKASDMISFTKACFSSFYC